LQGLRVLGRAKKLQYLLFNQFSVAVIVVFVVVVFVVVVFSYVCLFVFLTLQPTVVVFSQPGSGLQLPRVEVS
jgi:hypothetical protein